jgi:hypothetical protein
VGLVGLVGFIGLLKKQFPVEIIWINNHITWSGFVKTTDIITQFKQLYIT